MKEVGVIQILVGQKTLRRESHPLIYFNPDHHAAIAATAPLQLQHWTNATIFNLCHSEVYSSLQQASSVTALISLQIAHFRLTCPTLNDMARII